MTGEQPYKLRIAQNAQELFHVAATPEQMKGVSALMYAAELVA
jgi:hypothetical protein